ncbi:hypothetical protein IPZ68_12425 [Streptomyces arenae]|nr:hypothetical protein [Streptomyces arenae]
MGPVHGRLLGVLGACGVGEAATRRAVARLVAEGRLAREREGRWTALVLEPRLVALLTAWTHRLERAVEETPWRGTWQQLLLRGPAEGRAPVEEQLAFEGFGRLGPGVWIAADAGGVAALKDLLREQGIAPHATWLVARAEDDGEIVARAWDLAAGRAAHEEFVGRFGAVRADSDEAAFVLRTRLVHAWRGTFERDPCLPRQLLPPDWPGFASTKLFVDTWRGLKVPADRHWRRPARDPHA